MRRAAAIVVAAIAFALTAAGIGLLILTWGVPLADAWGFRGFTSIFALTALVVGLLVALRRPEHIVGWSFLLAGVCSALQFFGEEYSILSFSAGRDPLPAASWLGWLNVWIWVPGIASIATFAPLYFPDGRLLSPSWRPVAWVSILATVFTVITAVTDPRQIAMNMRGAPPPYDPRAFGPLAESAGVLFGFIGFPLIAAASLAGAVSVVRRYRRTAGAERQQIKWFAFGATWVAVGAAANVAAQIASGVGADGSVDTTVWKLAEYFLIAAFVFVIVSVGLAILRYRLYDIDRLIDRTIVYAVVSAILAGTYVAAVVSFQAVLRPITGGSELAVAVSTLLVVALFQPIRSRVQDAVDRRFYRSRYDAGRTLDAFTSRLRGDVDLDSVRMDLVSVLHETVRPAHASVWLRGTDR